MRGGGVLGSRRRTKRARSVLSKQWLNIRRLHGDISRTWQFSNKFDTGHDVRLPIVADMTLAPKRVITIMQQRRVVSEQPRAALQAETVLETENSNSNR
jgi:hypothetical protein